jgi:hypothetical protein
MIQGGIMSKLSENTLIPLGLAIVAIGGAAVWLTTIHLSNNANAENIVEIKATVDKYSDTQQKIFESINQIKQDVSEIKTELKYIRKK